MLVCKIHPFSKSYLKAVVLIGFQALYLSTYLYAQNKDKLIAVLEDHTISDTTRAEILYQLSKDRSLPFDSALLFIKKLEVVTNKFNDPSWSYKTNLRYGQTYTKLGALDKALEHFLKCVKTADDLHNSSKKAVAFGSIASMYKVAGQTEKAIVYYKKSIALLDANKDVKNLAIGYSNLGGLYRTQPRNYDSALFYFHKATDLFTDINFTVGLAYNLGNIGNIHMVQRRFKEASTNLTNAIKILSQLGDYYAITPYQISLAEIALEENDTTKALALLDSSARISKRLGLKNYLRDASLHLSKIYYDLKDYKKAYYHQNQYLIYRDSISSEQKIRELADLRTEYEVKKRETEIELLKTKNRNQYLFFAPMGAIIILLGIVSFLYYRNSRRKQSLNLILKERKEEAEAKRDELEAINQTREKFLSIISHDLMGPVNSFKGLSEIMKMSIDKGDLKDLKDIHAVFDRSIHGLATLLSNLLDWSVTKQGNIPYNPEKVVLGELVNELIDLFFNLAESKKIRLRTNIPENIELWADVNSVKTILRNLVSNALKFTDESGEIKISAENASPYTKIKVQDSGRGMPKSKIAILLSEDHYERSQGTKGEGGLGLGLQLVKEFVKMNHGKVEIESELGIGTTFIIYMPEKQPY